MTCRECNHAFIITRTGEVFCEKLKWVLPKEELCECYEDKKERKDAE